MKRSISIATILLATYMTAAAQWTQSAGPEGAPILTMAASGGTVLAAARDNSLFRLDGGRWTSLSPLPVTQLTAAGSIFFAQTPGGILRSSDAGASWSPTGLTTAVLAPTGDPKLIYAATSDSVFRSTDGGRTFSLVSVQYAFINTIAANGANVVIGSGVTLGYFRSTDGGVTWSQIGDGLPFGSVPYALQATGSTFHVSISGYGVYRSTDDGVSWTPFNAGLPVNTDNVTAPSTLADIDGRIWGTGPNGLFQNDGTTWTIVDAPASAMAGGSGAIYLGSGLGVLRSTNAGASWESYNAGIVGQTVRAMGAVGTTILADGFTGIHRTTDKGASWQVTDTRGVSEFATTGDAVLARTSNDGIIRSTDGGLTWSLSNDGINQTIWHTSSLVAGDATLFLGFFGVFGFHGVSHWESGGLHRSTDGGVSWQQINSGLPNDGFSYVPVWTLATRNRLVIASTVAGMYRSTDNGSSWRLANTGLPTDSSDYFGHLAFAYDGVYAGSLRSVYRSTDEGATWSNITAGLPAGIQIGKMLSLEDQLVLIANPSQAVPQHNRVFRFDAGTWTEITSLFPSDVIVTTLLQADDRIYAGTQGRSVWSKEILNIASVGRRDVNGAGDASGAVPNPFTHSTEIAFTLPRAEHARVTIVNAAGRIVSMPFEGTLEAGAHRIAVSLDAEPAGAYFYRVIADGQMQSGGLMKLTP